MSPFALQKLPFPEFAGAVASLLEALGYEQVAFMKPMHLRGKGRNAHGGYDIRAFVASHLTRSMVIVQLKQYSRPLPRQGVDELRGTMLRVGASQGLLVTTGTLSTAAIEAAQSGQYAAPVRLIDGIELASLLGRDITTPPATQTHVSRGPASPPVSSKSGVKSPCSQPCPLTIRVDVDLFPVGHGDPRW